MYLGCIETPKESAMINLDCKVAHIVAFGLLTVLSVGPVNAAILPARATSVTVRFHSQDLDTLPGVAGLYRRIRAAAQSVCGQPDDAIMLDRLIWEQCVDQAVAGAVASVHSGTLSAYRGHQIRGRKRLLPEAPEALAVRSPVTP
jgi:UrcA family protein